MTKKFAITDANIYTAWKYLAAQLKKGDSFGLNAFWNFDIWEKRYGSERHTARHQAEDELDAVWLRGDGKSSTSRWDVPALNAWIAKWLDERQRTRLMTALRVSAKRMRDGSAKRPITTNLSKEAHRMLKRIADFESDSLSGTLCRYLKKKSEAIFDAQYQVRGCLRELLKDETKNWLSTPHEALKGKTPEDALNTAEGLEKVRALLATLLPGVDDVDVHELERCARTELKSDSAVLAWLSKPLHGNGSQTVRELVKTPEGRRQVLAALIRIQHGFKF